MQISDLLRPERIACSVEVSSKKRSLEAASGLIASESSTLTQTEVFDSLIEREKLGSTGLGNGVAIPHGRISGREDALGAFIHLTQPIDFDSIDRKPVDLIFALLIPEHYSDEHLQILSMLAKMFSDPELCKELREQHTQKEVYQLFVNWAPTKTDHSATA